MNISSKSDESNVVVTVEDNEFIFDLKERWRTAYLHSFDCDCQSPRPADETKKTLSSEFLKNILPKAGLFNINKDEQVQRRGSGSCRSPGKGVTSSRKGWRRMIIVSSEYIKK
jgi:hypothetical protein